MRSDELPRTSHEALYFTGGTLPADASSYVERAADRSLLTSLLGPGEPTPLPARKFECGPRTKHAYAVARFARIGF